MNPSDSSSRVTAWLSIWTWFEIGCVAFFGFFFQLGVALLTLPFDRKRTLVGRTFRLIGVVAAKLTPYWRFGVQGAPVAPTRKTVVVSNHESQADPFLISHLPWEMKWLAKANLFKIPCVGWSMWLAGDIPLVRGESESSKRAMQRCAQWLDRGVPVIIFPEGTRSKTGELLPFKDGAFRLALENGADILPIAVSGTRHALPKHSWRFNTSTARVTVGTPISTQGLTLEDLPALKERARAEILALRASLEARAETPLPLLGRAEPSGG